MTARSCPVIRCMSRRKPATPQSWVRRLLPKLLTATLALIVMGCLWLFDTGALLMLIREAILAQPRRAAAIVGAVGLGLSLIIWLGRTKPSRPSRSPPKARSRKN